MNMAKTKDQIKRFLSGASLASEKDEHLIRMFAGKRKAKVPYDFGTASDYDKEAGLTFDQFEAWYNAQTPDEGDVVQCLTCGALGIVVRVNWNSFVFGVALTPDGNLYLEEYVITNEVWEPATEKQIQSLQVALAARGKDWNPLRMTLDERVVPADAKYVRLMVIGKQVGLGVFKTVLPDNTLEMYCVKMGNEPIRILDEVKMGDADAYSFADTRDVHREVIQQELADRGYIWNIKCRRIQKQTARVDAGTTYYWINSYLEVRSSAEKNSESDKRRFNRGNYFRTRDKAEKAKTKVYVYLKEEMNNDGD